MHRCLELARCGSGYVAPNPLVGAVLVYENKIIAEGYHRSFGSAHAEVNAIQRAIELGHESLLKKSSLYVNLEPCNHTGKTPPCTELLIKHGIKQVVIGAKDPFIRANGSGSEKLRSAGIQVHEGILENECSLLNSRFMTFHREKRPFVLLKFARTSDNFIASDDLTRKKISNHLTDILVHKWRSEESAIMVGTLTVETDNPLLTVRNWNGNNPLRITIDRKLRLPKRLNIFDSSAKTLVFNEIKNQNEGTLEFVKIDFNQDVEKQMLEKLYERNILSVMIEGGAFLLNRFIFKDLWDEARIITSGITFEKGLQAPTVSGNRISEFDITGDRIEIIKPSGKK
jgi:diaminohydroxyphosphoribosylaminopyrimidine deaminase/5-amino-6-(5-phosphoribosylamino)uracil reductase